MLKTFNFTLLKLFDEVAEMNKKIHIRYGNYKINQRHKTQVKHFLDRQRVSTDRMETIALEFQTRLKIGPV